MLDRFPVVQPFGWMTYMSADQVCPYAKRVILVCSDALALPCVALLLGDLQRTVWAEHADMPQPGSLCFWANHAM